MKRTLGSLLVLFILTLFSIGIALAQEAKPGKAEGAKAEAAEKPKAEAVAPETISGTIQSVVTEKKLVILTAANGIPFNFKVTGSTRIKVGGKKAKLDELAGQTSKSAAVKFLPLRSGNVAQTIDVQ